MRVPACSPGLVLLSRNKIIYLHLPAKGSRLASNTSLKYKLKNTVWMDGWMGGLDGWM